MVDRLSRLRRVRRLGYDPALDGLRAVAVSAVLVYHGGVGVLPAGFLGVDLFFVLSGYLITTLLLREVRDTGTIDLVAFWARRLRRLFPALVVLVGWVVVQAAVEGGDAAVSGVRGDAVATLFHVANWHAIAVGDDYFAQFAAPSPLQHTWSLAIEEQWYLVWPLVVALWSRVVGFRPGVGAAFAVVAAVVSASAMAVMFDVADPSRAYYGTDTRAHALLLGAALAFVAADPRSARLRSTLGPSAIAVVGLVGVAGFLWLAATADGTDPRMYRGGFLAAAVLSAAAIGAIRAAPASVLARVLAAEPLPMLGRLSYGLYLWHWPVFVALTPDRVGTSGWTLFAVRSLVSLVLASVSYLLVEQPLRRRNDRPRRTFTASFGAAAVVASLALAMVPAAAAGRPDRLRIAAADAPSAAEIAGAPARTPSGDGVAEGSPDVGDGEGPGAGSPTAGPTDPTPSSTDPMAGPSGSAAGAAAPTATPVPRPVFPPVVGRGEPVRALVVGDSIQLDLALGFDPDAYGRRMTISADVRLGCGTISTDYALHCGDRLESWEASTRADRPDVVLLALSKWDVFDILEDGVWLRFGTEEHRRHLVASLDENLEVLGATGARVIVVGLSCLQFSEQALSPIVSEVEVRVRTDPERRRELHEMVREHLAASERDVAWLDLGDLTCPDGRYRPELDGVRLHRDGIHFTDEAIPLVWRWVVDETVRIARRSSSPG